VPIRELNICVVEDNGMARLNLRNHLLEMGFPGVRVFSHGRELRADLKNRSCDLILMDFHLGDNKNGVEVIQDLQKEGLLKYSTCLIFITSDRLPMIIGQIVDIHPEDLVVKPYTIKTLERTINNALTINEYLKPVLEKMDNNNFPEALQELDNMIKRNEFPKSQTALTKMRARLLLKVGLYSEATQLYQSILKNSDKVIWAKWGLIHSRYLAGEIDLSEALLKEMLGAHLTNDKACEWLARISISKKEYITAEGYIEQIKESSLSLAAAKLKAYLFQIQDKMDDAIHLLERKREANRNVREKFAELSLELARCYLNVAEGKPSADRKKPLQVARFLIGSAGRKSLDENLELKRNYMNTLAMILEGNIEKATELLQKEGMENFTRADISTMTDAVQAFIGIGDDKKASEILLDCEQKLKNVEDLTEKTISTLLVEKGETNMGPRKDRALKFNKEGLEFYVEQRYDESIDYFYQAYILFPKESAFGINLLQSLVEAKRASHKNVKTLRVYNELEKRELSAGNKQRLNELGVKIQNNKNRFIVSEAVLDSDFGQLL
jgi:DNA-binding response OmpR family regulator